MSIEEKIEKLRYFEFVIPDWKDKVGKSIEISIPGKVTEVDIDGSYLTEIRTVNEIKSLNIDPYGRISVTCYSPHLDTFYQVNTSINVARAINSFPNFAQAVMDAITEINSQIISLESEIDRAINTVNAISL